MLMRDVMTETPVFQMNPDYIPENGSGLNPLLQNYWMVIHPPTLFLGFASTIVPFSFVIAALWKREYKGWVKPCLQWTLFSVMILGTGILMGGAWAYEALSFGGFWAWDPVENASLIPWLTLIAGLHTLVIYKSTGNAGKTTIMLFILTFLLVLYATFLTRSGILGDTSVHSFVDSGMKGQLIVFFAAFMLFSLILFAIRFKEIPSIKKEEPISSREFWMFIGSLVFVLAAMHITYFTSIPVINRILGTNIAPPTEVVTFYNKFHLPIAIVIALLSASIQFLKYKETEGKYFWKKIVVWLIASVLLTTTVALLIKERNILYIIFFFAASFSVAANSGYLFLVLSGKIRIGGASIAHIGFGIFLIGILISNGKQQPISINEMGYNYGEGFDTEEKLVNKLLAKGVPVRMNDYEVTYVKDSVVEPNHFFKIHYKKFDEEGKNVTEEFNLYPYIQVNPQFGLTANPDTRHYLLKDIFTHLTYATSLDEERNESEGKKEFKEFTIKVGDTIFLSKSYMVLEGLNPKPHIHDQDVTDVDIVVGAMLKIATLDTFYKAEPVYLIKGNMQSFIEKEVEPLNLRLRFTKVLPETSEVKIGVLEEKKLKEFVIMKAIVFPGINLVWLGCIVMIAGFIISLVRRIKEK